MASPGNILLVWDRAGDYHRARYVALKKAIPESKIYLADLGKGDGLYKWKLSSDNDPDFFRLSEKPVEKFDAWGRFKKFRSILKTADIDIVGLSGYGRLEYVIFLIWCWLTGKKVVLFAESWYGENAWLNALKGFFLDFTCNGFLVSGQRAKHHFEFRLGLPTENIKMGYSVVDNRHFAQESGVDREEILLCVARFSPEKNLERLISAFLQSKLSASWKLILVGGGPEKENLKRHIGDSTSIHLHEWLSYEALPLLYAQASFFILPSTFEPWGLVVNEAMAAGLPIALSKECGCAPDLVDSSNGFTFEANNQTNLEAVLDAISATNEKEREQMGNESKRKIGAFSPETWAKSFLQLAFG